MRSIDQKPKDRDGNRHGEWICYYGNGNLCYRSNFVHGIKHGLDESYYYDGRLLYAGYYNMNKKIGYWYYYDEKRYYLCLI